MTIKKRFTSWILSSSLALSSLHLNVLTVPCHAEDDEYLWSFENLEENEELAPFPEETIDAEQELYQEAEQEPPLPEKELSFVDDSEELESLPLDGCEGCSNLKSVEKSEAVGEFVELEPSSNIPNLRGVRARKISVTDKIGASKPIFDLPSEEIAEIDTNPQTPSLNGANGKGSASKKNQEKITKIGTTQPSQAEPKSSSSNASSGMKSKASKNETPQQKPAGMQEMEQEPAPEPERQPPPPEDEIIEEPEDIAEQGEPAGEKKYLIRFTNVSIISFLDYISRISDRNFIFDETDLNFNVTIISSNPTSIDNIMTALLQELRVHNLSLMEVGNNLIIHRNNTANSPGRIITDEEEEYSTESDMVTRVFSLSNSSPASMGEVIRPLLSSLAIIESIADTGHLIITDITPNIEKVDRLLQKLDTPAITFEIGQYTSVNADVTMMVEIAEKLLRQVAGEKPLEFVTHPIRGTVYVISTPHLVKRAIALLRDIDSPTSDSSIIGPIEDGQAFQKVQKSDEIDWTSEQNIGDIRSTKFSVYKLKYRVGNQIQEAIQAMGDSIALSSTEESELLITINSIQWIESSNSLIFTGTPGSIEKLTEFIDLIDVPVKQILVEVLMVETTVNNALNFGVDWGTRFGGGEDAGSQAFLSAGSPLVAALDTTGIGATVDAASSIGRTAGFNMGVIGRKLRAGGLVFNSMGALVNMLHTDTKSNVVMNPKLLVEENRAAEVFFGINTRYQTQSIANDEGNLVTSNFEFRDVGSTLKVTPIIGANDLITLEIDQEVSTVLDQNDQNQTTISSSNGATETVTQTGATTDIGPTTRKANTKTRIHVPNGYFVILSGMILDDNTRTRTQIPCLGGIPGLGAAFSQKSNQNNKRNLLLFIRPLIVEDQEIHHTTKRQQDIYRTKTPTKPMWEYETQEALDFLNYKDSDPTRKLYH